MGFYIFWLVSRMAHIQIAPSQNFLQIYHRIQKKSYKFAKNRLFCVCGVLGHDASVEAACKKMKLPLPSATLTGTVLVSLSCPIHLVELGGLLHIVVPCPQSPVAIIDVFLHR